MISAKEAISPIKVGKGNIEMPKVESHQHLLEVLPRLLDTGGRELTVEEDGVGIGVIDERSLLEAFGRMLAARYDSSVLTIECNPADYSASRIATAVEDADAHLVDLFTTPVDNGMLNITLRVRSTDASAVCASLDRYGYSVVRNFSASGRYDALAMERLLELRTLIEV